MPSKSKLPVIAVVPAYNAAETIGTLLDELIKQKYDQIFVIDDASTDETRKLVSGYKDRVELICGQKNVGSGANRNRIIGRVETSILHFIDADMKLLSKNTPRIIRALDWPKDTAYIGGMVRNSDGLQNPFNYGPRQRFSTAYVQGAIQYVIWHIGLHHRGLASWLRSVFQPILFSWPNIYKTSKRRQTFWTAESNMIIRSDLFNELGGYDPSFRYSEITDFSVRLKRLGLKTIFDPSTDVLHATMDNIFLSKNKRQAAHKQFLRKYGRLIYYTPRVADYLAGLKTQNRYHR